MTYTEKIEVLKDYLAQPSQNYRDTYKTDIYLFFNEDFTNKNSLLNFLNDLSTHSEIIDWVDLVTSQIVLKFDEDDQEMGNFIGEFI